MKFNQFKKEACEYSRPIVCPNPYSRELSDTDFIALGHDNNAWNVVRTVFRALLEISFMIANLDSF